MYNHESYIWYLILIRPYNGPNGSSSTSSHRSLPRERMHFWLQLHLVWRSQKACCRWTSCLGKWREVGRNDLLLIHLGSTPHPETVANKSVFRHRYSRASKCNNLGGDFESITFRAARSMKFETPSNIGFPFHHLPPKLFWSRVYLDKHLACVGRTCSYNTHLFS